MTVGLGILFPLNCACEDKQQATAFSGDASHPKINYEKKSKNTDKLKPLVNEFQIKKIN
jgi:hypothetical protein